MTATIQKWGNSLALRLPKGVTSDMKVKEGDSVELKMDGERLQVQATPPHYELEDLLRGITPENVHQETNWGAPVGKELW